MTGRNVRRAAAYAPAHVTGAFAPRTEARDPRARGSVGTGLVLDGGVIATAGWTPSTRSVLSVRADVPGPLGISSEVARRLLAVRPGRLTVRLRHQLPIGQGFGMSAAGAVATALAVAQVVGSPRARAIEVAHLAELFGGGGLGGVAAILGGGVELRTRPGIPPFGRVVRRPSSESVLVGVLGRPISTPPLLSDRRVLARLSAAYAALGLGSSVPSTDRFWTASERFTDRAGIAPREVRDVVRAVRRRGGRAAQAMFGRSFFARLPSGPGRESLLRWLVRREVRAVELAVGRTGARRIEPPDGPFPA